MHSDQVTNLLDTPCRQCGEPLGPEVFFGPVCIKCCRANHNAVLGKTNKTRKTTRKQTRRNR